MWTFQRGKIQPEVLAQIPTSLKVPQTKLEGLGRMLPPKSRLLWKLANVHNGSETIIGSDITDTGLPHRTGHGIGLDIHEWPHLAGGDQTPLAKGMCFSNEPMLVIQGKFGIRLEVHFYTTENGPKWFTQQSHSIDEPFAYEA